MQRDANTRYYVPPPSLWPMIGCVGLFVSLVGAGRWLHDDQSGPVVFSIGLSIIVITLIGWFRVVINETESGCYGEWESRSFRSGMAWMIFSEVLFFSGFFGALFYIRILSVPDLGGAEFSLTHLLLWPDFKAEWPLLINPDNMTFLGAHAISDPWHIPALNTLLLLTSGVTLTWAHRGLMKKKRYVLVFGLILTIALGGTFLAMQGIEYHDAYTRDGLTLNAGGYGSTFFILTGFHGIHVTVGTIILLTILGRSIVGHFSPTNHFGFQGATWYWHFVDVVWLFLFIFVYWL